MSKTARSLFNIAYARDIPRRKIALALAVSLTTINKWAMGHTDMKATDAEGLARFLGVEISLSEQQQGQQQEGEERDD